MRYADAAPESPPPASYVRRVQDAHALEDEWVLPEHDMPEATSHRDAVDLLRQVLLARVAREGRDAYVAANLGCRWNSAKPQIGVDPDIAWIEPAPPGVAELGSLRCWLPGHVPPRFAVEVVSVHAPRKDYVDAPLKYALLGTRELVVFDPQLIGPRSGGGPHVLQIWRRDAEGAETARVYAGPGPAWSAELAAWLVVMGGVWLRAADDAEGHTLWLTEAEEKGRALAEAQRAAAEAQRASEEAQRASEEAQRASEEEEARARRDAVLDLCEAYGVSLDDERRGLIASMGKAQLEALRGDLKRTRSWPAI